MALIKSISGIRGTIGGKYGDNLTPQDIVESAAAFAAWVQSRNGRRRVKVVIGRDGRISGGIVSALVTNTLLAMGVDVVDLGLSTTPTVEIAVPLESAQAGIIFTASHNPKEWNALKLLNEKGEFISAADGAAVLDFIEKGGIEYAEVDELGTYRQDNSYIQKHIEQIFKLDLVDTEAIAARGFKVVVDCINSTGAISVVPMLEALGCEVIVINGEMTGNFAHNPEPLPETLVELSQTVIAKNAHLGIAVDPDVDRLAFVCDDGEMFGEEYTLVAVADYVLQHTKGNTVSNLSSTRALRDVTEKRGGSHAAAAVGEVNVVTKMKETNAVIGGEGNGGVIYPALHYGRDALVGIALVLSSLAKEKKSISLLRARFPQYVISKKKLDLPKEADVNELLSQLNDKYSKLKNCTTNTIDGLKIDFADGNWIHMRKSNTEPIIRVYAESDSMVIADHLIQKMNSDIYDLINAYRQALEQD
ncbi:MAG: phosphoglucosamine mutase [Bacteroidota bacterium]